MIFQEYLTNYLPSSLDLPLNHTNAPKKNCLNSKSIYANKRVRRSISLQNVSSNFDSEKIFTRVTMYRCLRFCCNTNLLSRGLDIACLKKVFQGTIIRGWGSQNAAPFDRDLFPSVTLYVDKNNSRFRINSL